MPVCGAYIVPHPPLIVPEIGRGQEQLIDKTTDGYHTVARHIADQRPETVIVFSPHATAYADYINILSGPQFQGRLKQFGLQHVYTADMDCDLIDSICSLCSSEQFPAGSAGSSGVNSDHGTIVPLHFIQQYCENFRLVSIAVSALSRQDHFRFGELLQQAIQITQRRVVLVASGDLSHRLREDGPYGYAPEAPQLDAKLTDIMKRAAFGEFLAIPQRLCEQGAQCGLMSFLMMSGVLSGMKVRPDFLSYEGITGVGYAICIYEVSNVQQTESEQEIIKTETQILPRYEEHALVRLARRTLVEYVKTGAIIAPPEGFPKEFLQNRAGAFVSFKKNGELRGCIGTIGPIQDCVALEVIYNAISSGTQDPRFEPVRLDELDYLTCSVDVLSRPEPIDDSSLLDVQRYGVIVTSGRKRGLLLPMLEGIETVEEQIAVACRKAGIPAEAPCSLERFEVVRYT